MFETTPKFNSFVFCTFFLWCVCVCVLPLCGLRVLMFPFNIANEKTSIFNGLIFKSILYWTYVSNDMHAIAPEGSTQHSQINRNFGWFSIELSWFQTSFNQIDLFDRYVDFIDSIWWYSCSWWAFKFFSIAHISNWHQDSFRVFPSKSNTFISIDLCFTFWLTDVSSESFDSNQRTVNAMKSFWICYFVAY